MVGGGTGGSCARPLTAQCSQGVKCRLALESVLGIVMDVVEVACKACTAPVLALVVHCEEGFWSGHARTGHLDERVSPLRASCVGSERRLHAGGMSARVNK